MTIQLLFRNIALRILLLGVVGIAMTYVNDMVASTGFWGDTPCRYCGMFGQTGTSWGARHYWYFWTCTLLWLLGLVRFLYMTVQESESLPKKA